MDVTFEVASREFHIPSQQAILIAENLRLFGRGRFSEDADFVLRLDALPTWRDGALAAADWIELALVDDHIGRLPLAGKAAEAIYWVLRLMMDLEPDPRGAAGLERILGQVIGCELVTFEPKR